MFRLSRGEFLNVSASVGNRLPERAGTFSRVLDNQLAWAEKRFGPRDPRYILWAVEFRDPPCLHHRGHASRSLEIHLSLNALREARQGRSHPAFWQMAHECVHVLSPVRRREVNVLEEGLVCCFQHDYMRDVFGFRGQLSDPRYLRARALTRQLIALDSDAVKRIRQSQPVISRISEEDLRTHCPAIPPDIARELTQHFYCVPSGGNRRGPGALRRALLLV